MKVGVESPTAEAAEVIQQLLSPWNISFTSLNDAEILVAYDEKPSEIQNTILIPSDSACFTMWAKDANLKVLRKNGKRVRVLTNDKMVLTVEPQVSYHYDGLSKLTTGADAATEVEAKEDLTILTLDVIKEYHNILNETMNAEGSRTYRLLTSLPIPYSTAPKQIRNLLMRGDVKSENLTFSDILPMDALRLILLNAMEKLSNRRINRKTWNGKQFACIVTHDVDTQKGLQSAKRLKKLEEKYNISSAWYIPSKHYRLDTQAIKELANHGEIGTHDTRHDGKLIRLPKQEIVERLREAKQTIEKKAECCVDGFRAPLLQHSYEIIQAVHETRYTYDTSVPTWEPKHPYTMKPHGIGTLYPFDVEGVIEIPVTLPQDHQMIQSLGMSPRQTVEAWSNMMKEAERIGGLCVFLTHPDYELAGLDGQDAYEDLLNVIAGNNGAHMALPRNVAKDMYN